MQGVSVIIPCFNAAKYLRESVTSILVQEYDGPLEVLIGDDASMDDSRAIAESFGPPVRVLCDPAGLNRGMSAARNRCIAAATKPLIAFLDADDLWLPGHLSALAEVLSQRPDLGLAYDDSYIMSEDGRVIEPWDERKPSPTLTPDDLLLANRFGTGSVMVQRSVFNRVGVFDETLRNCADHDMWLRIVEAFPTAHIEAYGFCYRLHSGQNSLSPRLWAAAEKVLEKASQRYPYRRATIRKRKAVLAYRFGQIALGDRRYLKGGWLLFAAAIQDPLRSIGEIYRCLRRQQA